jgi:hypothetical protein
VQCIDSRQTEDTPRNNNNNNASTPPWAHKHSLSPPHRAQASHTHCSSSTRSCTKRVTHRLVASGGGRSGSLLLGGPRARGGNTQALHRGGKTRGGDDRTQAEQVHRPYTPHIARESHQQRDKELTNRSPRPVSTTACMGTSKSKKRSRGAEQAQQPHTNTGISLTTSCWAGRG